MGAYSQPAPGSLTQMMDALNEYPHEVSKQLLRSLQTRISSLLDAGCGTNDNLAKFVVGSLYGSYIGFDAYYTKQKKGKPIANAVLLEEKLKQFCGSNISHRYDLSVADVREIPDFIPQADVAHMRFVLMHLPRRDWPTALAQLRRKAKSAIVLMEYDWATMASTHRYGHYVEFFRQHSLAFIHKVNSDPYAGQKLRELCGSIPGRAQYENFLRPEGNYIPELVALASMQKDVAADKGWDEESQQFAAFQGQFERFISQKFEITFTPAQICTAVVRFGQ